MLTKYHLVRIFVLNTPFSLAGRVSFWVEVFNRNLTDNELNQLFLIRFWQALHDTAKLQPRISDDLLVGHDAFAVIDVHLDLCLFQFHREFFFRHP